MNFCMLLAVTSPFTSTVYLNNLNGTLFNWDYAIIF